MKSIPTILLYSRLFASLALILLVFFEYQISSWIAVLFIIYGIFSDIFDGIIARRLKVSTENLRLLDTVFDLFFYFSILYFIYSQNSSLILENILWIKILIFLEILMYIICLIRFHKLPSPHAILSKFWGLYLVIEFILLILEVPGNHFAFALKIGLIAHIDRVLIYSLLKKWDHDIPSSYHAFLIRNGQEIKRNDIFNG